METLAEEARLGARAGVSTDRDNLVVTVVLRSRVTSCRKGCAAEALVEHALVLFASSEVLGKGPGFSWVCTVLRGLPGAEQALLLVRT